MCIDSGFMHSFQADRVAGVRRADVRLRIMHFLFFQAAALGAAMLWASPATAADDTIKVGVLHSLSGTMAISETTLKDAMLMLIKEQNKKGGLLGKKLDAATPYRANGFSRVLISMINA